MNLRFSRIELRDLLKAWLAISLAFAFILPLEYSFIIKIIISAFTVGIGFLLHELSHKLTAQRYGCIAEFRSFDTMLLFAVALAYFAGIVFAAPGAVFIQGHIDRIRNGRISAAGPVMNIILAFLFFILALISPIKLLTDLASAGMFINAWLAVFNLIPFGGFDGSKVFRWNRSAYFLVAGLAIFAMMLPSVAALIVSG